MKFAAALLLLLALLTAQAFAQDDAAQTEPTPASIPDAPPPSETAEPTDPQAPVIVGKDKEPEGLPPVKGSPKCECCGMYWQQSPTRVAAVVVRGGAKELVNYESIPCMLKETAQDNSLVRFDIVDYTTAGTASEVMLDGGEAFYVYGARPIPGSSAPYIAAFADEMKAREAITWLGGGTSLNYGGMLKRWQADLAAAAASGDSDLPLDAVIPSGEDYFVCSCAAGDCDDVKSDVEGVCPKCGLTLVRRTEKLRLQRERAALAKEAEEDAGSTRK